MGSIIPAVGDGIGRPGRARQRYLCIDSFVTVNRGVEQRGKRISIVQNATEKLVRKL